MPSPFVPLASIDPEAQPMGLKEECSRHSFDVQRLKTLKQLGRGSSACVGLCSCSTLANGSQVLVAKKQIHMGEAG